MRGLVPGELEPVKRKQGFFRESRAKKGVKFWWKRGKVLVGKGVKFWGKKGKVLE